MKRFGIKILIFVAVFLVLDKAFILVRNSASKYEVDRRLEEVISGELNTDILVIGSSRGARNIIASEITKQTKYSAYNLSYPGSDISFHSFLLEKVLEHNDKPQKVLLVLDSPQELLENSGIGFRFDRLYPLVNYPEIRDELVKRGEKNYWLSQILILHQLNKSNFDFSQRKFTELDTIQECGSMPISFQKKGMEFKWEDKSKYNKKLEKESKIKEFKRIQDICISNDIELILVIPPNYSPANEKFLARINELKYDSVQLFHYNTQDERYKNSDYFYDDTHLMKNGAGIFTQEIIQYINEKK